MKKRYKQNIELLPVATPKIGVNYHVSWASRGVVGKCVEVDEATNTVLLVGPVTKVPFKKPVKWSELRHTRKYQNNPH